MKKFTFIVKNEDGSHHTNYEEELTDAQARTLRVIIYQFVKDNCT